MNPKNRVHCASCASGYMVNKAGPLLVWDIYKNIKILTPRNLKTPTCSHCGEQELTMETSNACDAQYWKCVALIDRLNKDF